jgi:membrane-bound ClpP family serine protease
MKANMGSTDRIIRLALAALFAVLFFTETVTGTFGIVLLVLAVVFMLTSIVSFCRVYAPFGFNTCSTKK